MSRRTCIVLIVLASVLGLAAWAGGGGSLTVHAQGGDNDYVDVALILEEFRRVSEVANYTSSWSTTGPGPLTTWKSWLK